MGGEGSGRKAEHDDLYHKLVREHQRKYDREIAKIRKERKCSFKEAQDIRMERLREEAREKLKGKEK